MTIATTMTRQGKLLMATGDLQLGTRTLKLVFSSDASLPAGTDALASVTLIAASGNYPATGVDLTGMALYMAANNILAVGANDVALTGMNTSFSTAAIYLPGTFATPFGSIVNPLIAVVDFGGLVTVNGAYTLSFPDGTLLTLN